MSSTEKTNQEIKNTVLSLLPDAKVLLFGSRVKGLENAFSDYDVLIITKNDFSQKEKRSWNATIHKALVTVLSSPVDVIMHSEEEVNTYKNYYGHIVRYAIKEGMVL